MEHSDKAVQTLEERVARLPDTVIGYGFRADKKFSGAYEFPRNRDRLEIHWPPNTVEVKPPVAPKGYAPFWNGASWDILEDPDFQVLHPDLQNET